MKKMIVHYSTAASVLAMGVGLVSAPVFAEAAAPAATSAPAAQSDDPNAIVVTGLKRDTQLVKVPVSVAVFDQMKIQQSGITQPADFLSQTSNVNYTTGANKGDFFINMRGQSTVRGAEPAVAILIDGAKVGTPAEFNTALFDLEQIEVLKGPQGAYYGRNATAGAIILTTKKPTEEFSGTAYASYGNNHAYNTQMSVSGALIPNALRARLSVDANGTDGSYTNVNTGEHSQRYYEKSGRLRMIFDNGGPFTVDARVTGIYGTGGGVYYTAKIQDVPGLSPDGTLVHGVPVHDISASKNIDIPYVTDVPGHYRRRIISGSVKADYDAGFATFSSITGVADTQENYSGKNFPYANPADASTQYYGWTTVFGDKMQYVRQHNTQVQQEFRLTSNGSHFIDYQAGFEFTYDRRRHSLANALNGRLPQDLIDNPSELLGYNGYDAAGDRTLIGGGNSVQRPYGIYSLTSANPTTGYQDDLYGAYNYAPYANAKINITSLLSLQLAGRYDIEHRTIGSVGPDEYDYFSGTSYNPCVAITGESAAQCRKGEAKTFRQFQPKVTLAYSLHNHGSVYASWGRSFKSGGFNPIGTREQTVQGFTTQYEALGESATAARAHAESSVITQDYYNKEVSTTYEVGFKLNTLHNRLYLNGAAFWTDVKNGQLYVFDPVVYVESIQSINKERVKGFEVDGNFKLTRALSLFGSYGYIDAKIRELVASPTAVGNRPPYIAHDTFSVGAQLAQPIGNGDKTVTARIEYNHTGSTFYSINNDPNYRRAPYGVMNARLGLTTKRWDFSLYGRNILNERYVNEIAPITSGASTAFSLADLATYGAEFRVRF